MRCAAKPVPARAEPPAAEDDPVREAANISMGWLLPETGPAAVGPVVVTGRFGTDTCPLSHVAALTGGTVETLPGAPGGPARVLIDSGSGAATAGTGADTGTATGGMPMISGAARTVENAAGEGASRPLASNGGSPAAVTPPDMAASAAPAAPGRTGATPGVDETRISARVRVTTGGAASCGGARDTCTTCLESPARSSSAEISRSRFTTSARAR